ncbi:GSCOCT00014289001.2-RA-CDS [Cotesia congregata]|uniref:Cc_bv13.2_28.9 n=2 Tax=root TaxID=1 RepID=S6CWJ0_COTCN|nr:GSCOCT00014289001.2-RA-CDS [Cotesia congregata]CAG5092478.1 cc_bv13.2_28.9 [Cotesia congregata]CCB96402.2 hypothetical protein BV13-2 [Bracoviriform congregatae]CCQ71211.1 hypothetical protein BV13-2 [Cotesia congregata]
MMSRWNVYVLPKESWVFSTYCHSKCFDRNPDDLSYLSVRREWYRRCLSDVQPSDHKGTPLYHPASADTSDIRLYELLHIKKPNVPYDKVETSYYNALSYSTCPDPSCPPELEPDSVGRLQKSLVAVTDLFKIFSDSCSYGELLVLDEYSYARSVYYRTCRLTQGYYRRSKSRLNLQVSYKCASLIQCVFYTVDLLNR